MLALWRAGDWHDLVIYSRVRGDESRRKRCMDIDRRLNTSDIPSHNRRRHPIGLIVLSACLTLGLLLAACPLGVVAIQHRVIEPPRFAVRFGNVEIAAPCPTRGFECSGPLPWYAVWWGDDQPDGSITYRQLYFIYLKRVRR